MNTPTVQNFHRNSTRRGDIELNRCLCGWSRKKQACVTNGCKQHPNGRWTPGECAAFEVGYKCHEKGMNLEASLQYFNNLRNL